MKTTRAPFGWVDAPDVSTADGKIAFTVAFDGFPTKLYVADPAAEWALTEVRPDDPVTIVDGSAEWSGDGKSLTYLGEDHGRARAYAVAGPDFDRTTVLTPGDVVVTDAEWAGEGEAPVVVAATPTELGDVWVYGGGEYFKLTDVNAHAADWNFPEVQLYTWQGADGTPVEGILELPPGYEKGDGPLPTVVVIHGGPTASTPYKRQFRIYGHALLAAEGYAVLAPQLPRQHRVRGKVHGRPRRPRERHRGAGHRHRRGGAGEGRRRRSRETRRDGLEQRRVPHQRPAERDRHRPGGRRGTGKSVSPPPAAGPAWSTRSSSGAPKTPPATSSTTWRADCRGRTAASTSRAPPYTIWPGRPPPTLIHVGGGRRPRAARPQQNAVPGPL